MRSINIENHTRYLMKKIWKNDEKNDEKNNGKKGTKIQVKRKKRKKCDHISNVEGSEFVLPSP